MDKNIYRKLSSIYAKAIGMAQCGGNGGSDACCPATSAGESLAHFADYTSEELRSVPKEAVQQSLGCGNPLAFAETRDGNTVIDLGCGAGLDLLLAAENVGPHGRVIGIDVDPEMVERARANVARAGLANVEVRQGEMERLPVASGSVDWVVSNCVINLSGDKRRVFAEIMRVLCPGGRLAISDVCAEDIPAWISEYEELHAACVTGAVPEAEMLAMLEGSGFRDVQVLGRRVYDAVEIAMIVERTFGDADGRILGGLVSSVHLGRALQGRISSVKFAATKLPATADAGLC